LLVTFHRKASFAIPTAGSVMVISILLALLMFGEVWVVALPLRTTGKARLRLMSLSYVPVSPTAHELICALQFGF